MPDLATVKRALPRAVARDEVDSLVSHFEGDRQEEQADIVARAWEIANRVYAGRSRKSGEPFSAHLLAVAKNVADLGLNEVALVAVLLHDAVEDTLLQVEDVDRAFGPEVSSIVDSVTKLDRFRFDSRESGQAATHRRMLVAIARDIRVLLVKMIAALHDLRTVAPLPDWKRERKALEGLEIYAPLARRLGMQDTAAQIEDLSFEALHPVRYAEVEHLVARRFPGDSYLPAMMDDTTGRVTELGIQAEVTGRKKHLYSVYKKMAMNDLAFDEVQDLIALRVIVESVRDCYAALGAVHATWKPISGSFEDFIARPKFNLYQSLHTVVVGPEGKPVEFQIRTQEMHERAETAVASESRDDGSDVELPWLTRIIDWEKETSDPTELMEKFRLDSDTEDVFAFTPQGQVVHLPPGSTPIDFAYAVHTEVGHRCVGAKVDGRLVSLSEPLESGQTVEIFTSKVVGAGPSRDWLNFASSHRASSKIKKWFVRKRREDAEASGRGELWAALRREGHYVDDPAAPAEAVIERVAADLGLRDTAALYAAIGEHRIDLAHAVVRFRKLGPEYGPGRPIEGSSPVTEDPAERRGRPAGPGVVVEGLTDVLVRLARCCQPVPGDDIIGFVTRSRGVSVHRPDCANAESLAIGQSERLIEVAWDEATEVQPYMVSLEIKAHDRPHLLADVSRIVADQRVALINTSTLTSVDRIAKLRFDFELRDVEILPSLIRSLRTVDGVYDVFRIQPPA